MEALSSLQAAAGDVDGGLKQALESRAKGKSARMYEMIEYFLGFRNESLEEDFLVGGKRFRPTLCLALAEGYGDRERAIPAALAIELFHNFTLIHDDIADHDETRRGRQTLWRLFGVDHALNAGDALSLLAYEFALRTGERALTDALLMSFYEVIEGQYLDFEASRGKVVSIESSLEMTRKKTGALVRVSAEAGGIAAGRVEDELVLLRMFGESLGVSFQLADDYRSVWETQEVTGKDAHSDVRERKQTLPYILTTEEASPHARERIVALYRQTGQLTEEEVLEAIAIMDQTAAREKTREYIAKYARKAKDAARFLSLSQDLRHTLVSVVDELSAV